MTLREQMDAALENARGDEIWDISYVQTFRSGFRAALALITNPDDEMVERCARVIYGEDNLDGLGCDIQQVMRDKARAVLKALEK